MDTRLMDLLSRLRNQFYCVLEEEDLQHYVEKVDVRGSKAGWLEIRACAVWIESSEQAEHEYQ